MTNIQAIDLLKGLEQSLDDYCELNDEGKTAFRMAITALELFGNSERLPSAQPEPLTDKKGKKMDDIISKQSAIDTIHKIIYGFFDVTEDDSEEPISEKDKLLLAVNKAICNGIKELPSAQPEVLACGEGELSAQPERTCVNCGRTINNGGWYADGRTRCPIEEHYALPKDGFCHLWEKRNVTDDDYPGRREE